MIINFGSINIDHVYNVACLPKAGETIVAMASEKYLVGKGINQSIAAQATGCETRHIGAVGEDGDWALQQIEAFGVGVQHITKVRGPTGHAIITVDSAAENQIIIAGGANQQLTKKMIDDALQNIETQNSWILLQNETNLTTETVLAAKSYGLKIAYAAAPFIADITIELLPHIDLLAVNEGEANQLANVLGLSLKEIPVPQLLVTRGNAGAEFISKGHTLKQPAFSVEAIDTTGAGDTFLGSFLGIYALEGDPKTALEYAAAASALQVTRLGAAPAIPSRDEVLKFLQDVKPHDQDKSNH